VSPVTILVTGDYGDINIVYINTSEQFNTATPHDFSDSSTTTLTYSVVGTGSKTLYAWFEDALGNTSNSFSLTFTVLAGKSMDPAGDQALGIGNSQTFQIAGAGAETYAWSIVDATTLQDDLGVASIVAGTPTSSAVVTGVSEGSIKVKAETTGVDAIYSGTITVAQSGYTITHSYKAGLNVVPFSLSGTGLTKASDLKTAIETANPTIEVQQIFGWLADEQKYQPAFYLFLGTPVNDFDLVDGSAYFVRTDGAGTLELKGSDFSSIPVLTGLNLISAPYSKKTSLTGAMDLLTEYGRGTGLEVQQIFGWLADEQKYQPAFYLFLGTPVNDFAPAIGTEGYFVRFSGAGTYTP
jgi:hypothetical protein